MWITGISGVGKTTLGECLASQAWDKDRSFQWIYLEILEGQSSDFASVAADLLAKLGDRDLDPQERNNPEQLAKRLLQKLRSQPYWIQMDSLERLLNAKQPTEFVDAYWATFLQLCLTEQDFRSHLVLTAQAFPTALVEFNDRYSNVWTEHRLGGLSQVEQQLEFFAKRGIIIEAANQDILSRIAKIYEGHPLVLKVIAEDVLNSFSGNVSGYWQANQREFEQVARELQDIRPDETEYNELLDRKVRDRIRKSIEQLPLDALDLLCRSSVFRRPVPKKFWLAMIDDRSVQEQKAAYRVLDDRALVEKEDTNVRLHNLIRAIANDLLKANNVVWEASTSKAAHLWLVIYEPEINASNLDKARGYLEAFEHHYEVGNYEQSVQIVFGTTSFSDEQLRWQLFIWGLYTELFTLSKKLTGKVDRVVRVKCLLDIGNCYSCLGKQNDAIKSYVKALDTAQEIGDRLGEGRALCNLGLANHGLSNYTLAINYYNEALLISREIADRQGESNALNNLGLTYRSLGNYQQSLEYLQQRFDISSEIGDALGQSTALGNLGLVYYAIGNYQKSIYYHEENLNLSRKLSDPQGESNALGNLGLAHHALGRFQTAIDYSTQRLAIAQKIGDREGEALALRNLGKTQIQIKHYSEAAKDLCLALEISQDICDRSLEAEILKYLTEVHYLNGDFTEAKIACRKALKISIDLGMPLAEECKKIQLDLEKYPEEKPK